MIGGKILQQLTADALALALWLLLLAACTGALDGLLLDR